MANGGSAFSNYTSPILQDDMIRFGFAEARKRRDYIAGETVKYLALHYSTRNRDFRPAELYKNIGKDGGYTLRDIYGMYDMLGRSHVLVDFLHDKQLADDTIGSYAVLLLSNSACLSDRQADNIREFVDRGGTLIATHQTSTMDELGRRRGNFALADVFGLDHTGPHQTGAGDGVVYVVHDELAAATGYVLLPFSGIESTVSVRSDAQIEVLCTRSSLQGEVLPEFNPKMEYDTGEPTVTVNRFGRGSACYISGDVGRAYVEVPYPPLMRFLASLIGRTPPPIQVEAPAAIEVTAAIRPSGELMIHLLNNPSPPFPPQIDGDEIYRYYFTQEIVPVHDIRIRLHGFKGRRAWLPLQESDLALAGTPQEIVVPRVELHEVVPGRAGVLRRGRRYRRATRLKQGQARPLRKLHQRWDLLLFNAHFSARLVAQPDPEASPWDRACEAASWGLYSGNRRAPLPLRQDPLRIGAEPTFETGFRAARGNSPAP